MRRLAFAVCAATALIVVAFALDASLDIRAYSNALYPGYIFAGWLDGVGVLAAFDSSGDLAFAGIVAALAGNLMFWGIAAWLLSVVVARVTSRRRTA